MHHYDPVYISASDSKYQVVIGDQVGVDKSKIFFEIFPQIYFSSHLDENFVQPY